MKFPTFYGTRKFIIHLHWDPPRPYPDADQFSPYLPSHFLKIGFNIITLSSHLRIA